MMTARATTGRADGFGATETNGMQIRAIDCCDSLGYGGIGREEHSGENPPQRFATLPEELADNDLAQVPAEAFIDV